MSPFLPGVGHTLSTTFYSAQQYLGTIPSSIGGSEPRNPSIRVVLLRGIITESFKTSSHLLFVVGLTQTLLPCLITPESPRR